MNCVLAIDIGGTKLAAALVDEEGSILRSATRPTPRTEVMSALAALIAEVTEGGPAPEAVGIGCAGPLDLASGTVSPVNMPSWRGFPLRDEVQQLTGLPTVLAGDAQCFALGEHWLGAGRGCASLLGIVVSTGIGGGLVINGAPLLGPTGNAGHVGHMSIDPYGERCECGGRGCVERYASGPNMVRWALENGWSPTADTAGQDAAPAPSRPLTPNRPFRLSSPSEPTTHFTPKDPSVAEQTARVGAITWTRAGATRVSRAESITETRAESITETRVVAVTGSKVRAVTGTKSPVVKALVTG
ncbi:ROK family protein [Nonomuraea antimicrobica]